MSGDFGDFGLIGLAAETVFVPDGSAVGLVDFAFAFAFVVAEGVGDAVGVTRSARARLAASASITRPRCSGPASAVGDP